MGFPLVVALVVLLGIVLVWYARGSRDPVTSPTTADHWHAAYTIYNCGEQMPVFLSQTDPDGIHSHGDSLIHIHPYNSSATGADARIGVFLDAMNASIDVEGIFADNGEFSPILASDGCGGEPGVIKAARWSLSLDAPAELVEVFEDGFDDIRLLGDGEGFSFALVAVGDDPPPPAPETVTALVGVGAEIEWQGPDPLTTTTLDPLGDGTQVEIPVGGDGTQVEIPVEGDGTQVEIPVGGDGTQVEIPVEGDGTQVEIPVEGDAPAVDVVPVEGDAPAGGDAPVEGDAPAGDDAPADGVAPVDVEASDGSGG